MKKELKKKERENLNLFIEAAEVFLECGKVKQAA